MEASVAQLFLGGSIKFEEPPGGGGPSGFWMEDEDIVGSPSLVSGGISKEIEYLNVEEVEAVNR